MIIYVALGMLATIMVNKRYETNGELSLDILTLKLVIKSAIVNLFLTGA